jgi:hypothetical protein
VLVKWSYTQSISSSEDPRARQVDI